MDLKDYMQITGMNITQLSRAWKMSRISIRLYLNKKRRPHKRIVEKIDDFTKGLVTEKDLWKIEEK